MSLRSIDCLVLLFVFISLISIEERSIREDLKRVQLYGAVELTVYVRSSLTSSAI